MEAHVRPACRARVRLEASCRLVPDDESHPVVAENLLDLRAEPALVPELDAVASRRERLERVREPVVVAVEVLGQLPEHRAELACVRERLDAFVETTPTGAKVAESLDMCVHLDCLEVLRVVLEPVRAPESARIEDVAPVRVVPARAADVDVPHRSAITRIVRIHHSVTNCAQRAKKGSPHFLHAE